MKHTIRANVVRQELNITAIHESDISPASLYNIFSGDLK